MTQVCLQEDSVQILGARGSLPVSGRDYLYYGGSTACVLLCLAGETILLDAGTGIRNLPEDVLRLSRISLLLSHCHADHIIGLPMCPYLAQSGGRLDIYAVRRDGLDCGDQVTRLFSPPLWPVTPEQMPAETAYHIIQDVFEIGDVRIDVMEGCHPGGVSLFRLTGNGKRVVYMSDTVINKETLPGLAAFAKGCDLLLCDGQYSEEEFQKRSHFGHSSWEAAAELGRFCHAKKLLVIHHDPAHTDDLLGKAEKDMLNSYPDYGFAREGMVVQL